jgi:hypothetical protein
VTNGVSSQTWMEYSADSTLAAPATTAPQSLSGSTASHTVQPIVSALTRDVRYYYRLVSEAGGVRYYGQKRSFFAGPPTAPSVSNQFTLSSWSVRLNWAMGDPNDVQSFLVDRRDAGGSWTRLGTFGAASRSYLDLTFSVLSAHAFEYRIAACNRIACSAQGYSTPVNTPALTPPVDLVATPSGMDVSVTWTNTAPGYRSYGYYRRPLGGTPVKLLGYDYGVVVEAPAAGSFGDHVTAAGSYSYYATFCVRGECATSNEDTVALGTSGSAPEVGLANPSQYIQKQVGGTISENVSASVDANGLPTTAWAEYGLSPTALTSSTASVDAGYNSYPVNTGVQLTGLLRDTTYYVRIAAQNSAGTARGGVASFWTGAPDTVTNLTATVGYSSSGGTPYAHLVWQHNGHWLYSFTIERRSPGGAWSKIAQRPANNRDYYDTPSSPGPYDYRVTACNYAFCSAGVTVSALVQ